MDYLFGVLVAIFSAVVSYILWRKPPPPPKPEPPKGNPDPIPYQILSYYGASALSPFKTPKISIDGQTIDVPIATMPDWFNLNVPLSSIEIHYDNHRGQYVLPAVPHRTKRAMDQYWEKLSQRELWDDPIYRLTGVSISETSVRFDITEDSFMNHIRTNGPLAMEAEGAITNQPRSRNVRPRLNTSSFPIRDHLLPNGNRLGDISNRLCAGGVSVLLAIARGGADNDYVIPIVRRSSKVALGAGRIAVCPQGMYQPLTAVGERTSLLQTVYRELYEELLGGEEVDRGKPGHLDDTWFVQNSAAMTWILEHPEDCTSVLLCFGYNLITGNGEFGTLLAIQNPEFWSLFGATIKLNWENTIHRQLSTKNSKEIGALLRQKAWTPESPALFALGLQRLRQINPDRVSIPDFQVDTL